MSVFLIALAEPDETAWSRLRDKWPDRHRVISDTLAMVAPGGVFSAMQIKEAVGIGVGDAEPAGLVVDVPRLRIQRCARHRVRPMAAQGDGVKGSTSAEPKDERHSAALPCLSVSRRLYRRSAYMREQASIAEHPMSRPTPKPAPLEEPSGFWDGPKKFHHGSHGYTPLSLRRRIRTRASGDGEKVLNVRRARPSVQAVRRSVLLPFAAAAILRILDGRHAKSSS